jgi:hypothetical protein
MTTVVLSAVMAFRPSAEINLDWVLVTVALTLPWGALTWLFVWALIHDNTHYFAMVLHVAWAILNALLGLQLARRRRRLGRNSQLPGNA